ncbi:MAG: nuclear transport factor 2 family protein [Bacteroidota bacterium]
MDIKELVHLWFSKWEEGDFHNLPISDDFKHTSPFGTIEGKKAYLQVVAANTEKFLGHRFQLHDEIYSGNKACVRYTGLKNDFSLAVSEWYYVRHGYIEEIIAYYHIGEIREERKIETP